ncbi:MAG: energy-coupling factor ABC transporter ATP-binding protein [Alistipes sp.]|nr:energy-coupling factor ABC transporter ATP-binding protein [Alistipes sp.]
MSHHYLRFERVSYRYPDAHEALHDISFELRHGEKAAVVGVNGAGKSTLLLHTDGLLLPTSGRIVVGGMPITKRTLPVIRRTVGYVFQQPDDQLFMPTVGEDVAFGPANMGLDEAEIDRRVVEALTAVGAESLHDRSPAHLSGGQKKRVAIATVLALGPSVLGMDEPTAALDPQARRQLIDLIRGFSHTTLIATHDMELVRELCTRVLVLHRGTLAADGPADEILSNHELLAACGLE